VLKSVLLPHRVNIKFIIEITYTLCYTFVKTTRRRTVNNLTIDIWENLSYKPVNDFRPTLTTYLLEGKKQRGSILICPGGGYSFTSPREAEPIALQFNAAGFHAFVLNYSVAPHKHPQPLLDVSRSMCIIRRNAVLWNLDTDNITVCGFSAGGHLAASLGVHWNHPLHSTVEGITLGENKPNKLILAYPVITSGPFSHQGSFENLLGKSPSMAMLQFMSLEKHISVSTPPTFIWHTFEDTVVPLENTLLFANGLRKNQIPFELHIFPKGGHGISLATDETSDFPEQCVPHASRWMELCVEWLKL
jgi:acetyl esterase/lipase